MVSWQTPEGAVSGYRLTCASKETKDSSGDEVKLDDPTVTSATFEKLSENTEYLIKIYTVDGDRESERVKVNATTSESG